MKTLRSWSLWVALLMSLLLAGACAPTAAPPTPTPPPAPKVAPGFTPAPAPTPTPTPAVTFAGKTIAMLLPVSVGGSADIAARQMMPFLQKHLPGNPTVIVQNMPGGGQILGSNWLYNVAPKDGTVVGQLSLAFTNSLFKPKEVRYDLAKLRWLGGMAESSVLFAHANLGIKSAEELTKATKDIFYGTTGLTTQRDMPQYLFLGLLEQKVKVIAGYGSSGDTRAAVLRGELNMAGDSLTGYFAAVTPLIAEGKVIPLAQAGIVQQGKIVRDPTIPDIPTYTEVLLKAKGDGIRQRPEFRAIEMMAYINGLNRGWVYVEGVPEEVMAAVAKAFEKMLADPEMLKEFEKGVGFKPITLNAAQAQQVANEIVKMFNNEPDIIELVRRIAREAV